MTHTFFILSLLSIFLGTFLGAFGAIWLCSRLSPSDDTEFTRKKAIKHKTKLATLKEKIKEEDLKASVYSPSKDPMNEFNGTRDDWDHPQF